jgi:hypothetical protein
MVGWWQQESLIKLESPTSTFIVAPSNSGKTVLAKNILKQTDGMFKIPPTKIFFCYTVYQPLYDEMKKEIPLIEFYQGLPTMDTLTEWGAIYGHRIVVLDDLMMDAANSDEIVHLMCIGSHHHQITVIHILQNLFQKGKSMRTASLICHFILMASKRDTLQINTLGRQVFPGQLKFFMRSFELATQEKFSYLLLTFFQESQQLYIIP